MQLELCLIAHEKVVEDKLLGQKKTLRRLFFMENFFLAHKRSGTGYTH
jgi:hypothetical protein